MSVLNFKEGTKPIKKIEKFGYDESYIVFATLYLTFRYFYGGWGGGGIHKFRSPMSLCRFKLLNLLYFLRAFSQTLRRYTSLNHLAQVFIHSSIFKFLNRDIIRYLFKLFILCFQAARAVLQNNQQITQMLADLNR